MAKVLQITAKQAANLQGYLRDFDVDYWIIRRSDHSIEIMYPCGSAGLVTIEITPNGYVSTAGEREEYVGIERKSMTAIFNRVWDLKMDAYEARMREMFASAA